VDLSFDPGSGGRVHAMALRADGKVVLGGRFSEFNGVPRSNLVRLHGGEGIEFLPSLKLTRSAGELMLTWPAGGTADALLEFSDSLGLTYAVIRRAFQRDASQHDAAHGVGQFCPCRKQDRDVVEPGRAAWRWLAPALSHVFSPM
jgi:hypothetical protein